ncbi:MAG TPA: DUF3352 domain-containing protein [Fimbriimonadaceae bacterium]|nr:DUF3352 domain-containing protein [Fimbriimonadaceae bacterium]
MKLFRGRFGGVKIALLSLVGAAVLGFAGYKFFFNRTGEAAVALIPSDASCVVTLDTHPSEGQVAAFKKLSDALKREGLDNEIENGVSDIVGEAGIAKDVRQYLTHNLAGAWWVGERGTNSSGIGLLSISDPGAVSNILVKGNPVQGAGVPAYTFGRNGNMVVAVVGDYLAISDKAETIARVVKTRQGAPSMADQPEYRAARNALPPDANFMFFASPRVFHDLMAGKPANTTMWVSFGASLRDGGIQFDYRGPVDTKTFPGMAQLSNMRPLSPDLLKKLPPDAYGLIAYASADKYITAMRDSFSKMMEEETVRKQQEDFEQETGLSIDNDILPAFKGDVVFAMYPDAAMSKKSADCLLMVDNANGGTPADLVEKVRAFIERKSAEEAAKNKGPALHFVQSLVGKVTVWRLDPQSAAAMRKELAGKQAREGEVSPFSDKTISYAVANGTVLVASSDALMTKALLTFNGDRSLAEDAAFMDMSLRTTPKDQCMVMCSLSRVFQAFGENLGEMGEGHEFTPEDVINLFGGPNTGLVGSGYVENNAVRGTLFLPLDFDRMAKLIRVTSHPSTRSATDEK